MRAADILGMFKGPKPADPEESSWTSEDEDEDRTKGDAGAEGTDDGAPSAVDEQGR